VPAFVGFEFGGAPRDPAGEGVELALLHCALELARAEPFLEHHRHAGVVADHLDAVLELGSRSRVRAKQRAVYRQRVDLLVLEFVVCNEERGAQDVADLLQVPFGQHSVALFKRLFEACLVTLRL